jgi:hypothetical protein
MANSFQKTIEENSNSDCLIEGIDSKMMDYRNIISKVKNFNPMPFPDHLSRSSHYFTLTKLKNINIDALILGQSALKDDSFY